MIRHKLEMVVAGGQRTTLEISVGVPYSRPDDVDENINCWYGSVEVKGIREKVHHIGADDPFEALVLCIMFVKRMILSVIQNGARVVVFGTDEDYPINEIFDAGNFMLPPGWYDSEFADR